MSGTYVPQEQITPRLLSVRQAATYLGCSYWTVRDWVLAGHIPTISLPGLRPRVGSRPHGSLRRVLVDRQDLDAFIEARKQPERARDLKTSARQETAENAPLLSESETGVPAGVPTLGRKARAS